MFSNQPWIQEFESLPPDEQSKVIDFVHALASRRAVTESTSSPFELIQDLAGIVKDAPADLSTNPAYLKDYGR